MQLRKTVTAVAVSYGTINLAVLRRSLTKLAKHVPPDAVVEISRPDEGAHMNYRDITAKWIEYTR